jgi:hypothetical protein
MIITDTMDAISCRVQTQSVSGREFPLLCINLGQRNGQETGTLGIRKLQYSATRSSATSFFSGAGVGHAEVA